MSATYKFPFQGYERHSLPPASYKPPPADTYHIMEARSTHNNRPANSARAAVTSYLDNVPPEFVTEPREVVGYRNAASEPGQKGYSQGIASSLLLSIVLEDFFLSCFKDGLGA